MEANVVKVSFILHNSTLNDDFICSKVSSYRYVIHSSKLIAVHSVLVCRNLQLVDSSFVEKVSLQPTSLGSLSQN